MPWARGSQLDRHLECPEASYLPRHDRGEWSPGYLTPDADVSGLEIPEMRDTSAADWGTAMHEAKALSPDAQDPWLTLVEPWRDIMWPAHLGEHEVAVSYDAETGKVLTFRSAAKSERDAWKAAQPDSTVVGECDWFGQLPSGMPWVCDLKTGWRTPPVITNQTMFYLLARMKLSPEAHIGQISICHWPKRAAEPTRDGLWRKVSATALSAFEGQIQQAWRNVQSPRHSARPGAHCLYCPSASVCPRGNE
jgi:hypothetical protein